MPFETLSTAGIIKFLNNFVNLLVSGEDSFGKSIAVVINSKFRRYLK